MGRVRKEANRCQAQLVLLRNQAAAIAVRNFFDRPLPIQKKHSVQIQKMRSQMKHAFHCAPRPCVASNHVVRAGRKTIENFQHCKLMNSQKMVRWFSFALGACCLAAHADMVTEWNSIALNAIKVDRTSPPKASRV